jgi:Na+-driven multidrug efflux pump
MTDRPQPATYTEGPIGLRLATMASHMVVGLLAIAAFNATDMFFVSRLGESPLAAMSFVRPMAMIGFSLMFGLGIGVSAVLSKLVGQGDGQRVRRLTTDTVLLTFMLGLVLAGGFAVVAQPLFSKMGAQGETLALARQYTFIWIMGFPIGVLPMVVNNAIRANGDTRTPALIMSISAILNALMDPLFIFGVADLGLLGGPGEAFRGWLLSIGVPNFHGMGIRGAAWATVISRCLSTTAAMSIIHFRLKLITFSWPGVKGVLDSWKRVLTIGIPASLTHTLNPLSMLLVTGIVFRAAESVGGGDAAVAALGPGGIIEFMAILPVFACASVILPFVGQNCGAGRFDRVRIALKKITVFVVLWSLVMAGVISVFARPIAMIFSGGDGAEPQVLIELTRYVRIIPWGFAALGLLIIAANILNAFHRPMQSVLINITRTFVLMVPLSYLGSKLMGVTGAFFGMMLANAPAGLLAMILVHRELSRQSETALTHPADLGPGPGE